MKKLFLTLVIALSVVSLSVQAAKKPVVQMAILLDTSGSMQGLIEQAKAQLWSIVNEMAKTKKEGISPKLEIALYEYGKSTIPKSEGYLRMILPFTTDLDSISEELFKLKTNGGEEYCGTVIQSAVKNLRWTKNSKDYKSIFVAGNEPFTQGKISYEKSCKLAIRNGIIINTIFCGNKKAGVQTKWKDGADLADGQYMNIDHNKVAQQIKTPYDKDILKLNQKLNQTYIPMGTVGAAKKSRQSKQDSNAKSLSPSVLVERSVAKASSRYKNESWDLIDATLADNEVLEKISDLQLPANLRGKSNEEIKQYIQKMNLQRKSFQKEIQALSQKRQSYILKKRKKAGQDNTLEQAMLKSIQKQLHLKGFKTESGESK